MARLTFLGRILGHFDNLGGSTAFVLYLVHLHLQNTAHMLQSTRLARNTSNTPTIETVATSPSATILSSYLLAHVSTITVLPAAYQAQPVDPSDADLWPTVRRLHK
jgi:hypothetical protein